MASESTKKSEAKKSTTKATATKKTTTTKKKETTKPAVKNKDKVVAKKEEVSKKETPKKVVAKKKESVTKTEPKKKEVTKNKDTLTKPEPTKKSSTVTKTTTKKKTTATATTPSRKVVKKEVVKKIENIEPPKKEEVKEIKQETIKKNVVKEKESHEHFGVYAFLLSTVLICLHVMGRFTLDIDQVTIGYSVILFSTVYFITNVITKKFDFKQSIFAIIISTIALLIFVYFSKYLNTKVVDYFVVYGQVFAYIISQLLNLIIYYYLLVNTELKARWIYLTYVFALAAYYFISILFSTRIIMTENFWPTFFCSLVLSSILAVMYAFYDCLIRRGQE